MMKLERRMLPVLAVLTLLAAPASCAPILSIVLSNEGEEGLIDRLVAAGHGDDTFYEVFRFLQPFSGGSITTSFLNSWAALPPSSEVHTFPVSVLTDPSNNPAPFGEDGVGGVAPAFGSYFDGLPGYTTHSSVVPGLGSVMFTNANSPDFYIEVFAQEGRIYAAATIIWAGEEPPAVPEPSSLVLATAGLAAFWLRRRHED